MTTTDRIFNFSAGPATLPLPVLEEAQRDLISLPGLGMSVMEVSHRSKAFENILNTAIEDIRELASVPSNFRILMLQGGASLQFSMVPMNLLPSGATADYTDTGYFAKKAIKEAQRLGTVNIAGQNFSRIPNEDELNLTPDAAYLHITNNNTIEGTEWKTLPETGRVPLINDASSDIFSRPIDIERHGLIYAGAQKNLGPSGLALVIVREDLLERGPDTLPSMLNYRTFAETNSLFNTPNTFAIYILGLTVKWLRSLGGLSAVGERNEQKAAKLYAEIDRTGFYEGNAEPESRSLMNVTFRLPTEELAKTFIEEAGKSGLAGLKGHRSIGGIRASIYNAFPEEGVDRLVEFMGEFEKTQG